MLVFENRFLLLAPVVLILCIIAWPAARNTRRYDNWIQSRLDSRFAEEERFHNLRVEVERGIVSIRGSVKLLADKTAAISIARSIEHVRGTVSHIRLDVPNIPDNILLRQLQATIEQHQFQKVDVKVRRGVVTITGTVGEAADRQSVVSLIASTQGVRAIDDRLKLRPRAQ